MYDFIYEIIKLDDALIHSLSESMQYINCEFRYEM